MRQGGLHARVGFVNFRLGEGANDIEFRVIFLMKNSARIIFKNFNEIWISVIS